MRNETSFIKVKTKNLGKKEESEERKEGWWSRREIRKESKRKNFRKISVLRTPCTLRPSNKNSHKLFLPVKLFNTLLTTPSHFDLPQLKNPPKILLLSPLSSFPFSSLLFLHPSSPSSKPNVFKKEKKKERRGGFGKSSFRSR